MAHIYLWKPQNCFANEKVMFCNLIGLQKSYSRVQIAIKLANALWAARGCGSTTRVLPPSPSFPLFLPPSPSSPLSFQDYTQFHVQI
ncbi:hypothetical protein GBAR_LOCUS129, partial [Geodia barretti]